MQDPASRRDGSSVSRGVPARGPLMFPSRHVPPHVPYSDPLRPSRGGPRGASPRGSAAAGTPRRPRASPRAARRPRGRGAPRPRPGPSRVEVGRQKEEAAAVVRQMPQRPAVAELATEVAAQLGEVRAQPRRLRLFQLIQIWVSHSYGAFLAMKILAFACMLPLFQSPMSITTEISSIKGTVIENQPKMSHFQYCLFSYFDFISL